MGSSKTANMLMIKYNFEEKGKKAILLKPKLENRDGATKIKSRIRLESKCLYIEDYLNDVKLCDCILIDEAQFMTTTQVDEFVKIADMLDIPIIAFGLKTDFQGHLFEGSKRLLEVADDIQEITTICWCGKKARFNARVVNGEIVKTGEQLQLGGNESYVSLCRLHYNLGQLEE
jgi:thymidine kinase